MWFVPRSTIALRKSVTCSGGGHLRVVERHGEVEVEAEVEAVVRS